MSNLNVRKTPQTSPLSNQSQRTSSRLVQRKRQPQRRRSLYTMIPQTKTTVRVNGSHRLMSLCTSHARFIFCRTRTPRELRNEGALKSRQAAWATPFKILNPERFRLSQHYRRILSIRGDLPKSRRILLESMTLEGSSTKSQSPKSGT